MPLLEEPVVQKIENFAEKVEHEIKIDLGLEKRSEGEVSMCQESCSSCVIA